MVETWSARLGIPPQGLGILMLIFGLLVIIFPQMLAWLVGILLIVVGVLVLVGSAPGWTPWRRGGEGEPPRRV